MFIIFVWFNIFASLDYTARFDLQYVAPYFPQPCKEVVCRVEGAFQGQERPHMIREEQVTVKISNAHFVWINHIFYLLDIFLCLNCAFLKKRSPDLLVNSLRQGLHKFQKKDKFSNYLVSTFGMKHFRNRVIAFL